MKITGINVYNMYPAILGIRNSFKSVDKSDTLSLLPYQLRGGISVYNGCELARKDTTLIGKLLKNPNEYGHQERKFLRQILVSMDITGSIKFWSQMDTFKVGTVRNSESTMHRITSRPLNSSDFEVEINKDHITWLNTMIDKYNSETSSDKKRFIFNSIDANLPGGYLLKSQWTGNYENLRNIYHGRKHHKMYWWKEFIYSIERLPYFDLMIK